ncbi:hypothetical protein KGMB01110_09340 [Mediterraneibacter butyricigenes]|uniref:Uncharacterized protein n=1 Tax=Mediterraneibacter butyricigenes TaxID=2316025 RepID=A0A391P6J8_9FIRM|nr:hypothetical protein [Mediterraneibacter butyricigenes]GCA66498.1 hypothetical protein KGMB01110_09340 [Mediterraneibacter butyricigenes]
MKEIGGYIELDENSGTEYHNNALALNSGRHCVEYLIRAKEIKKMYLPLFLCSSIREICEKCSCEFQYYEINSNFKPNFSGKLGNYEYIYIVNYYGQLSQMDIQLYKQCFKNVILDNTQAFFQYPIKDVDTLYSCRKYFGVSDGGYLYTDTALGDKFELDYSYNRIHYILGRYEVDGKSFYAESSTNNDSFSSETLKHMSKLTHHILRGINYNDVKEKREKNFNHLHEYLKTFNRLQLNSPIGPFMYPLYSENAKEIKKSLLQNNIYIPTLWPDVFESGRTLSLAWEYSQNIVPLPCDQRYRISDMNYLIDVLERYL